MHVSDSCEYLKDDITHIFLCLGTTLRLALEVASWKQLQD